MGGQKGRFLGLPENVKNLGGSTGKEREKIWVGKGEGEVRKDFSTKGRGRMKGFVGHRKMEKT